jgi:hypothetical protein
MSDNEKKEIDISTDNEMDRLKDMKDDGATNDALKAQMAKVQNYEAILVRISAFLDEILKTNHRSTYMITMAKDIIDNRNNIPSTSS